MDIDCRDCVGANEGPPLNLCIIHCQPCIMATISVGGGAWNANDDENPCALQLVLLRDCGFLLLFKKEVVLVELHCVMRCLL